MLTTLIWFGVFTVFVFILFCGILLPSFELVALGHAAGWHSELLAGTYDFQNAICVSILCCSRIMDADLYH